MLRSSEAAARSGSERWMGCFRPAPSLATAAAVKEAKGKRPEVEVEPARGGGEDVWSADADAEVAQGGAFPEHLVIMVNGLVGRWIRVRYGVVFSRLARVGVPWLNFRLFPVLFLYSADDWKFAAEQFVRRMPDKVIVHRELPDPFICRPFHFMLDC